MAIQQPMGDSMPSIPRRLACSETWASNQRTASLVELPGLTAWVYSVPARQDHAGGDVHYVSVCPSCIVSRIALADVSGHGQTVAVFGERLRELMHRYLLDLEQIALMRDLNQVVHSELGGGHYATMVAVGFHGRRGLAVMTNAGHPPPLWHHASRDEWNWLEPKRESERKEPVGLPLGLFDDVTYDRLVLKPQGGDLLLLFSDGVCESKSPAGIELGREGLIDMVRTLDSSSAEALGTQLESALRAFRGGAEPLDDETIIVLKRTIPDGA
jgi:sigma-B regulation protein RsbU (phosphoserine phosphatase)